MKISADGSVLDGIPHYLHMKEPLGQMSLWSHVHLQASLRSLKRRLTVASSGDGSRVTSGELMGKIKKEGNQARNKRLRISLAVMARKDKVGSTMIISGIMALEMAVIVGENTLDGESG
jgi:hypothetical protein